MRFYEQPIGRKMFFLTLIVTCSTCETKSGQCVTRHYIRQQDDSKKYVAARSPRFIEWAQSCQMFIKVSR